MQPRLLKVSTFSSPRILKGVMYLPRDLVIRRSIALMKRLELLSSPSFSNVSMVSLLIFWMNRTISSVRSNGGALRDFFYSVMSVRCRSFSSFNRQSRVSPSPLLLIFSTTFQIRMMMEASEMVEGCSIFYSCGMLFIIYYY